MHKEKDLGVFIPTYKRASKLLRCVESVENSIRNYMKKNNGGGVTIYISNNEKNDKETERIINLLCEKFDNIVYFTNEKNIGIDCNHDKVYEYCNEEYGLFLADDDVVFENAIAEIMIFINQRECLFAICNSYTMDGNEKKKKRLFNLHDEDVTKYDHLSFVRFFAFKRPISLLPLLPYYGGIIVNIEKMKQRSKKFSREIFCGTFHQYIGAILNVFFESNDMKCFIIGMPVIGIGMDNDKTWFEYKEKVYEGVERFYKLLCLPVEIKNDLVLLYQYEHRKILGKFVKEYLEIKSMFWII